MRWLFYLLLAGNAALFGWGLRQLEPQAAAPPPTPSPTTVNRLLLLSELEAGALRERRAAAVTPAPEAETAAAPARPSPAGQPSAPAAAAAQATLDAAVAEATREDLTAAPASSAVPERLCYSVGPLADDDEIGRMRAWLEARDARMALRADERREVALYWVHFPPAEDRQSAVDRVERMRIQGIDDTYIIPGGDMRNAVSLGLYSRRDSLERRLRELRGKGYEPSVSNRYRSSVASWFDAELPSDFELDGERFAAEFPNAQLEPVDCALLELDTPAG